MESTGPVQSLVRSIRTVVSQKKKRFKFGEYDLDLTYITPRIIAMGAPRNFRVSPFGRVSPCCLGFPSSGTEGIYRNPLPEVQRFFAEFHPGKFMIFNLCSEREYAAEEFGGRVQRFPFDDHNPCPLEMIADFCKAVDDWLSADKDNVVAVHCKAGKVGRVWC
jgi:phosphatidylinositol-3,4,5-trisphosphate 3-phosphatase and dual-specificity protein phosphatase PTEN